MEIFRYSVIRFRPFAETGEFANIGIVVLSLADGKMGYELAPRRFGRIRGFFDAATHEAYGGAIDALRLELGRITEFLPYNLAHRSDDLFEALIEQRESSIIFSRSRTVQGEVLQDVLDHLFVRFVKRDFMTADSAEVVLTRDIRSALRRHGIRHFKAVKLPDDIVPVMFPLAYKGRDLRAIRPLAFSQRSPLGVFDYGAHWKRRLEYLLNKRAISGGNVLIAVDTPVDQGDDRMLEAQATVIGDLRSLPFDVVDGQIAGRINPAIVAFAAQSLPHRSQPA